MLMKLCSAVETSFTQSQDHHPILSSSDVMFDGRRRAAEKVPSHPVPMSFRLLSEFHSSCSIQSLSSMQEHDPKRRLTISTGAAAFSSYKYAYPELNMMLIFVKRRVLLLSAALGVW